MDRNEMLNWIERKSLNITLLILVFMSMLGYFQFVGNERVFAAVSDVWDQFIPEINNLILLIKEKQLPLWSFYKGLGNQMTVGNPNWLGDPFTWLIILLGGEHFPYWFGLVMVIKIILAGFFFFMFLRELNVAPVTRIIFSILYAFNGHMVCRGFWIHYATEVVFVALWLWSLECYYKKAKKCFFSAAFAILLISRNAAYVYIYSGLSFAYVFFREVYDSGLVLSNIKKRMINFIPVYFLGLLLSTCLILPGIISILQSPRIGSESLFFSNPFEVVNLQTGVTTFAKMFSYSILGSFLTTGPNGVILEDPVIYCGILSTLLFPQVLKIKEVKKSEIVTLKVMLFLVGIYYIFPYVRYFLNAFSSGYYKTSSFWSILFILAPSIYICSNWEKDKITLEWGFCFKVLLVYLLIWTGIFLFFPDMLSMKSLVLIAFFLVSYVIILLSRLEISVKLVLILFFCCFEILFGLKVEVDSTEFFNQTEEDVFPTEIKDAVNFIKREDSQPFYRIIIDNDLAHHRNYGEFYGYMGTGSYVSIQNKNLIEFYEFFDIEKANNASLNQFNNREKLNDMLAVKYFIKLSESSPIPEGYVLYYETDDFQIYKNTNFLPLGFVYHSMTEKEKVESSFSEKKDDIVLKSAILDSYNISAIREKTNNIAIEQFDDVMEKQEVEYIQGYDLNIKDMNFPRKIVYESLSNDPKILMGIEDSVEANTYFLEMDIKSLYETEGQLYYDGLSGISGNNTLSFKIKKGKTHYQFQIDDCKQLKYIRLDVGDIPGVYEIENLKLMSANIMGMQEVETRIRELGKDSFVINSFKHNNISGSIRLDQDGILFFSIPFDKGWNIMVNGEKIQTMEANGGFLAIPLLAGEYEISLEYTTPGLIIGCLISLIAACIWIKCIIVRIRKRLIR